MDVSVLTEDGHTVQVPADLLPYITLLKQTVEMGQLYPSNKPIPLPKIRASTLGKVLEWAALHKDDPTITAVSINTAPPKNSEDRIELKLNIHRTADDDDDELESSTDMAMQDIDTGADKFSMEELDKDPLICPADRKFLESIQIPNLIDLTAAANYLAMEPLLDVCCKSIASQMSGLSVEELRVKFNIPNDFTPEEEAKLKAEFGWADE